MTKSQILKVVLLSVAITWLFNVFAGRFLVAKISTWPVLNRLHILSPQAPIVITNQQTIRVSDSGDAVAGANEIKSKISLVVQINNSGLAVIASAVNLSSDGTFVSAAPAFVKTTGDIYVILNDGRSGKITGQVVDPATSLVFLKADVTNVPVVNLASTKDLNVGEKVLFAKNSLQNFIDQTDLGFVSAAQNDIAGQVWQSDYPRRSFGAHSSMTMIPGEALANTNADLLGIWNGAAIISADVLKQAMSLYFSGTQKISRPSFGFSYYIISQNESKLTGQNEGALVKAVSAAPAKQAGLAVGDIITKVDSNTVNESSPLEQILEKYKPGDAISLAVLRKSQQVSLTLTTGDLK